MKQRIINVLVGFILWIALYLLYNTFFETKIGEWEMLIVAFFMSIGNEFLVPMMVRWGQNKGWVSRN